jgi:hypothetical protein
MWPGAGAKRHLPSSLFPLALLWAFCRILGWIVGGYEWFDLAEQPSLWPYMPQNLVHGMVCYDGHEEELFS